jgi:hypothetical protein
MGYTTTPHARQETPPPRARADTTLMREYEQLVTRGCTWQRSTESSGPDHGNRGPELEEWLVRVARPWFRRIEALAAEDGLEIVTYQGFDEYLPGSTPCARLR